MAVEQYGWPSALTAFLGVNLADVATTWVGLERGYNEVNLLPSFLLSVGGVELMYLVKLFIVLLVMLVVLRLSPCYPRLWHGIRISNVLIGLVVLSNFVQLVLF